MGLSIQYRGTLTDKRAIYRLIDEAEDIARAMQWPYAILDQDWSRPPDAMLSQMDSGAIGIAGDSSLKGIGFQVHPKSEWINLFFNASCVISSPLQVAMSATEGYPAQARWQSVRTQAAGPEAHAAIVRLLQYFKDKYLHDLEVSDGSRDWEARDYGRLKAEFGKQGKGAKKVAPALEKMNKEGDKEIEDIVERIEKVLKDMQRRGGR